jgi:hypothetical protein
LNFPVSLSVASKKTSMARESEPPLGPQAFCPPLSLDHDELDPGIAVGSGHHLLDVKEVIGRERHTLGRHQTESHQGNRGTDAYRPPPHQGANR